MASILVPLDFSTCATHVVHQAQRLASAMGQQVDLLHVVQIPAAVPSDTMFVPADELLPRSARDHLIAEASQRLAQVRGQLTAAGVDATVTIVEGFVVDEIVRLAEERGSEMIVIGTHGRTGLGRLVLGSVAESVIRQAPCPVVATRFHHRPECTARSCSWCDSARSPASDDIEALVMG